MHTSRTATTLVACLAFLLGLVTLVGGAAPSDAQEQATCPAGTAPSADGTTCVVVGDGADDNVVTTTSCIQGVLSDDGQYCIVPRLDATPAPAPGGGAPDTAPAPAFTG